MKTPIAFSFLVGALTVAMPVCTAESASLEDIPDFSYAGYQHGEPIPSVAGVESVDGPVGEDCLGLLQGAIDKVEARAPDSRGFRGAVEIASGTYKISAPLRISADGVVLRGRKGSENPKILRVGASGDAVVVVEPRPPAQGMLPEQLRFNVVPGAAPIGQKSLRLEKTDGLELGQRVWVTFSDPLDWLVELNRTENVRKPFTPGRVVRRYVRTVARISADSVTLDAPLYDPRRIDVPVALLTAADPVIRHIGIEHLQLIVKEQSDGAFVGNARAGCRISSAEDSWISDVTVANYVTSGIELTRGCVRMTISGCTVDNALNPERENAGYAYRTKFAQLILFSHCSARRPRVGFAQLGGSFDSGIVISDCETAGCTLHSSASLSHWVHAVLLDRLKDSSNIPTAISWENRHDTREGEEGWSMVDSVVFLPRISGRVVGGLPPHGRNQLFLGPDDKTVSAGGIQPESNAQLSQSADALYVLQRRRRLAEASAGSRGMN